MKDEHTAGASGEAGGAQPEDAGSPSEQPAPRLRSTKGGGGAAAGATPKKSSRPTSSARPRRAGKKPDAGPR